MGVYPLLALTESQEATASAFTCHINIILLDDLRLDSLWVLLGALAVVRDLRLGHVVLQGAHVQLSLLDGVGQLVLGPRLSLDGDLGLLLEE